MACDNFSLTISTKKTSMHQPAPGKSYVEPNITIKKKTTEGGRKVRLSPQHPLKVYRHGWRGEHQTRKSECSLWPTQMECLESERHLGSNQNQGVPSCHFWLWNVGNLSMAYKETTPLSNDLSEEDSRHHMAKIHCRYRSFNSGFFSKYVHHLDAITASLGRSCCPHERSLPPEETALRWTISAQVLLRRPEKALQKHTDGLCEIFWYRP